ncbi:hypothetical protein [Hoeflea ulvae]|uniref:Uncharacterized protein n=1 Tax=Hoeflea ulvae TaxID=2983764 RepID=A0ABT3YER8_9HYPH|nr:hypothetical protein [Hoeflea ulvae]MCY0094390.1 hypothetical protein [Hoeflea ulvae]
MSRLVTPIITAALAWSLAGCVAPSGPGPSARPVPDNFHTLMPPKMVLRDDTVAAATHDRSASRLAYVGVWAPNGDACAMMDQTAFDGYAVITPDSIRRPGETCSFEPGQPGNAAQSFDATCKVGRATVRKTISVLMSSSRKLRLTPAPGAQGQSLVRCHLQE